MAERIKFYFDPICPWCYVTSKWISQLERLGEVEVSWGIFSLDIQNSEEDPSELRETARAATALRTAVKVREVEGDAKLGAYYKAVAGRVHDKTERIRKLETVQGALSDVGLDPALAEKALADDATWDAVVTEHADAVERLKGFGVPTIVLDGGEGLAIFGPVISTPPGSDEEALELFRHVLWLTRYDNFHELKRERAKPADLASVRAFIARRAEQAKQGT